MIRKLTIVVAALALAGCGGTHYDCSGVAHYKDGHEEKAHGVLNIYGLTPFITHLDFRPDDTSFFPLMPNCTSFLQDYIQCGGDKGYARFDKILGTISISESQSDRVYKLKCKKINPAY